MNKIAAFVGHSFADSDEGLIRKFTEFFDTIKDLGIDFTWDHATKAEPIELSRKVREKMEGKNLFIGICTAKEMVISLDKVPLDSKDVELKIALRDTQRKTSDWILQEIGYAFGQDMRIILLLEGGLRDAGELQGNLERIPFNRESPDKSFTKILQMISAMRPTVPSSSSATTSLEPTRLEPASANQEEEETSNNPEPQEISRLEPQDSWEFHDYLGALYHYIITGDDKKEELINKAYLEAFKEQDEENLIKWRALRLYHRLERKRISDLSEITQLAKDNPNSHGANSYLAGAYELYEQYSKAGRYFLIASKCAKEVSGRFMDLCEASVAFAKDGDLTSARSALEEAKDLANDVDDAELHILQALLHIYPAKDDVNNYLCFMERLVDIKPDDNDRRFSLAYKYSESDQNDMALFHYKVLSKQTPTEIICNNRGVAEARLKLPSKSVQSYQKSAKLGNTLAMSNLAHEYIKAGFLNEAYELCQEAVKSPNFDKRIGAAITKIEEVITNEEIQEKEIIEKAKEARLPFIEYAQACTKKSITNLQGKWQGPVCVLSIEITDGKFQASGRFETQHALRSLAIGGESTGIVKMNVSYSGDVIGHGIMYQKQTREEGVSQLTIDTPIKGLMIVSDDLSIITVYVQGASSKSSYTLSRVD